MKALLTLLMLLVTVIFAAPYSEGKCVTKCIVKEKTEKKVCKSKEVNKPVAEPINVFMLVNS